MDADVEDNADVESNNTNDKREMMKWEKMTTMRMKITLNMSLRRIRRNNLGWKRHDDPVKNIRQQGTTIFALRIVHPPKIYILEIDMFVEPVFLPLLKLICSILGILPAKLDVSWGFNLTLEEEQEERTEVRDERRESRV
ncbi:hypothetical protein LguiA_004125 [Lonicera macranthoides]